MADLATSPDLELRMSREEYRRWSGAQPTGRFERIEGVVVAMAPERAGHNDLKMQVWLALRQALATAELPCHVYGDGMTVQTDDSDFEPDVVLHCGERLSADAIAVPEPLVVVEVLSPSTRGGDLTRKLVGYFRVPSIQHYLVFWVDRPQVVHHRRRQDGQGVETRMLTEGEIRTRSARNLDYAGDGIWGVRFVGADVQRRHCLGTIFVTAQPCEAILSRKRHVKLLKRGGSLVVHVPLEFTLPGEDAIMRKGGDRLTIELTPAKSLLSLLAAMGPLAEDFPLIADPRQDPVRL